MLTFLENKNVKGNQNENTLENIIDDKIEIKNENKSVDKIEIKNENKSENKNESKTTKKQILANRLLDADIESPDFDSTVILARNSNFVNMVHSNTTPLPQVLVDREKISLSVTGINFE